MARCCRDPEEENIVAKGKANQWLHKLFGRGETSTVPTDGTGALDLAPEPVPKKVVPPSEDPMALLVESGSLLQLWQRWKGENAPAPVLYLNGGPGGAELPLSDGQELSLERIRLKTLLEKDAKQRLQQLQEKEKTGGGVLDAACKVYVSKFAMVAWAFIFPPSSPEGKLPLDEVGEALEASGVTSGVDSTAVLRLAKEDVFFELVPLACGTPPVQGSDGKVVEYYAREVTHDIKVDENGVADYRSTNYVQVIEKDTVICDIVPPVEGQPGVRVDGKLVEPKKVHPVKAPIGPNTTLSEDGTQLLAGIDGHLIYNNGAFQIRPLLDVQGDVDYSTGNIDYRGDVHIHGDVRENFFVRATGTVTVDGTVEAANIEAGGDLIVSSGVLGDNRATIKSGGCIRVKYLESCVAYAAQGVYADCIVSSHVYSDDIISVTTGRGTIIGGTMTAARMIKARMIGSQANMKTALVLGELPYVQEKLRNGRADLKTVRQELKELNKELEFLEEQQGLEGMSERLAKTRLRRSVLCMKESQLRKRQGEEREMEADLSRCRLEADTIYPVTTLKISEDTWKAEDVRKACTVTYDTETGSIAEV
jgi:hypothetical protein